MERRCPYCDGRLLEDDTVCWQCGRQVTGVQQSSPPAAGAPEEVVGPGAGSPEAAPEDGPPVRASALTIYGGLTVVVVLIALLLTIFLGRRPLVQTGGVPLQEGWIVVTDRARTFTLTLPAQWQTLDVAVAPQREQVQQLLEEIPSTRRATTPLGSFVDDDEVLFLATGARQLTFLLVSESRRLNRLNPQDAIDLARGADAAVLEANHVQNFDKSHVALRVALSGDEQTGPVCRQQFITGEDVALLLALCAEPGQLNEETVNTILNSVQRLAP